MRQPRLPHLLVARANPEEDVERRERRLVIFQHQHLEPVRKRLTLDRIRDSRAREARTEKKRDAKSKKHDDDAESRCPKARKPAMIAKNHDAHRFSII